MSFLIIDWWKFIAALILLLTPVRLFQGPHVHFREIDRDWDRHWPQILSLWLHYFDFARAALGTWLLLASLQTVPGAQGLAKYAVLFALGGIRILAVFLQMVPCKETDSVNAPFAFVTGVLLLSGTTLGAPLALILAITMAAGSRTPAAFFPLATITFAAITIGLGGKSVLLKTVMTAACAIVPWLWSLLFHKQLVVAYRSRRADRTTPPIP